MYFKLVNSVERLSFAQWPAKSANPEVMACVTLWRCLGKDEATGLRPEGISAMVFRMVNRLSIQPRSLTVGLSLALSLF